MLSAFLVSECQFIGFTHGGASANQLLLKESDMDASW